MTTQQWLSAEEARARILSAIKPIDGGQALALPETLMRVLAEDIRAPFNVPGHDNSAMDGFACKLADVERGDVTLAVRGGAFAGHPYTGAITEGECVKIMTGAKVPAGADIIIPQEETADAGDAAVTINAGARRRAGQHIRAAGEDLRRGETALNAGAVCYPAQIGLMASLGLESVKVRRQLRVAFFSTGDEVRAVGEPLGGSDVYDSNRHTLRAMIQRLGFEAVDCGIVRDDRQQLAQTMDDAAGRADVIITSGGASVGEADYIRQVLAERGDVLFWKVAMRPGRPLAYGKINEVDFFGLPGNPVSAMVCFYQFVQEALWRRAGRCDTPALPLTTATTATDLRKTPGRTEFQRGYLSVGEDGGRVVTVTGDQGSGILSSMTRGNCFIILPADCAQVCAGDVVTVQPFAGLV